MASLQSTLQSARSIVVLAGAGLSTASGLSTFRGTGGLWRTYSSVDLATPEAFARNPGRVREFYEYRRQKALQATPNAAHALLASLSSPALRQTLAPACTSFTHITQNVDGHSVRALAALSHPAPPASKLIEMHGSILEYFCTVCKSTAGDRGHDPKPICEALEGAVERVEAQAPEERIPSQSLPRCEVGGCGGLMRPDVVWFGEVPKRMDDCVKALQDADVLLVVGTSGTVYPAAGFAAQVQRCGGKVAVFNLEPSDGDDQADFVVIGKCEETLMRAFCVVV